MLRVYTYRFQAYNTVCTFDITDRVSGEGNAIGHVRPSVSFHSSL